MQLHHQYIGNNHSTNPNSSTSSTVEWSSEIVGILEGRRVKSEAVGTPPLGSQSYAYVPLSGFAPDMTSCVPPRSPRSHYSTNYYVDLQRVCICMGYIYGVCILCIYIVYLSLFYCSCINILILLLL